MKQHSILIYILLAIVITNLIRVTPMVLIKGELHNRFVRSFLYYVPYVTLAQGLSLLSDLFFPLLFLFLSCRKPWCCVVKCVILI